jgi:glycosyltransferase involved in cell wall biosynthesis
VTSDMLEERSDVEPVRHRGDNVFPIPGITAKSIHVFTSDFVPFPGCPDTAEGHRSLQLIEGLRRAGHRVTFSMALENFVARKNKQRVLPHLGHEEIWACENFGEPEVVLNRIQPDIAIYCNISTFRTIGRFQKDIVHIADLNGPTQFEALFWKTSDEQAAMRDGYLLQSQCQEIVEKLRQIDYAITVSERQKYFWSAYCSLAGFNFSDLNILVCPPAFECSSVARKPAPQMTVVYCGGFHPWQNPDRFLRAAAEILDDIEGASLDVFGEPHAGAPNAQRTKRMLDEIQQHRCVKYHGYRPFEELVEAFSRAWCALELMEQTVEREVAVTGPTVAFLASATPVICNTYSTLSNLIERYNAGRTMPTTSPEALRTILHEFHQRGIPLVEELSRNAKRLAAAEFSPDKCMRPLVELCAGAVSKRSRTDYLGKKRLTHRGTSIGQVLAISPMRASILALRVTNPLRALQRQGLTDSMTISGMLFHELKEDRTEYSTIIVQRAVPEFIIDTLHTLGLPFALECDDNLLAHAAYRDYGPEPRLVLGLKHCSVLTTPNPRLTRLLEKYSGMRLGPKAFIAPNALPFSQASIRTDSQPSQIVWIQSDMAALDQSREAVFRAVDDFSSQHGLPVILIGPSVLRGPKFRNQVVMGEIDFDANLQLLESAPLSIGVAPLETNTDHETIDFICGKSDLKILLFAGYGHAGVYSDSPPYRDSGLQAGLSIAGNGYAEWMNALDYQYREGWKKMPEIASRIQRERHIDVVAREAWRPALEACALSKPVRGMDLYEAFTSAMQIQSTTMGTIAYTVTNWDIARNYIAYERNTALGHFAEYGQRDWRYARHTSAVHEEFLNRIEQESKDSVTRVHDLIRKRDALIDSMRGELTKNRETFRSEIAQLEAKIERLEREISLAHTTLNGMANSRSWRVTGPLRKVSSLFKR